MSDSCNLVDCSPPSFLSMGFPRQEPWRSCYFLLQLIILTQGSNSHLLHWSWIIYYWATREATYTCVCVFFYITGYYKILCHVLCAPSLSHVRLLATLLECSPPGSCVHGILQAGLLEWFAVPSSRGPSQPRDRTLVSHIAGRFFTIWATREARQTLRYWILFPGLYTRSLFIYFIYSIVVSVKPKFPICPFLFFPFCFLCRLFLSCK